jgi:hypothetical protein
VPPARPAEERRGRLHASAVCRPPAADAHRRGLSQPPGAYARHYGSLWWRWRRQRVFKRHHGATGLHLGGHSISRARYGVRFIPFKRPRWSGCTGPLRLVSQKTLHKRLGVLDGLTHLQRATGRDTGRHHPVRKRFGVTYGHRKLKGVPPKAAEGYEG